MRDPCDRRARRTIRRATCTHWRRRLGFVDTLGTPAAAEEQETPCGSDRGAGAWGSPKSLTREAHKASNDEKQDD